MAPPDPSPPDDPIAGLLERYAYAVATRDADLWGSTWCAEALWERIEGEEIVGRDAIVASWIEAMAQYDRVDHRNEGNISELDPEAGTGTGRATVVERVRPVDGSAERTLRGHYDDEYRLTDSGWCFVSRRLVRYPS